MKKRRLIGIAAVIAGLAVIGLVAFRPAGPRYQGKPLTEWLDHGTTEEIHTALKGTGPEGIGYLIELLQADDHGNGENLRVLTRRFLPFITVTLAQEKQRQALSGFQVMETNTLPLLGSFSNLLHHSINPVSVALAITATGSPGIPVLTNALSHPDAQVRFAAISALGFIGPDAHEAVPPMLITLFDPVPLVRSGAAESLGEIHAQPDLTVPALIRALDDSKPTVRHKALGALVEFGPAARPAIPKLKEMLNDNAVTLRTKAAEALKEIESAPAETTDAKSQQP